MFHKHVSHLAAAKTWYNTYKKEIKLATSIKIKNHLLAQELEEVCSKQHGVLTYAEYLTIEQFGKNGFYATSKFHGQTDIENRWGSSLANYCLQNGHKKIIEFGCGTGELGIAIAKANKQLANNKLTWIGVEIDKNIHKRIYENFVKHKVQDAIEMIVSSLDELPSIPHALIIFPYSLDNIPPHVFLNTTASKTYPDALLGISVKNRMISETIIPQDILLKKGMDLQSGIFSQNGYNYKLSGWKLRKGQRAYISPVVYATLYSYAKKFADPTLIIIDEFSKNPWLFGLENVGTPKSLYEKNLITYDRSRYYRESGKHNLYYPLYIDSLYKFLFTIGFQSIEYDIEQKKASELRSKKWFPIAKNYTTYAFYAKGFVDKKIKILPIPSPPKRII